jgi:hypothetical protein
MGVQAGCFFTALVQISLRKAEAKGQASEFRILDSLFRFLNDTIE